MVIIGDKIKRARMENGLTQEELANRCELSKGFISLLERDLTSPSIATLVDILECLGTNLQDFFNETVAEKIVFTREEMFVKENKEMKYRIEWVVPNSQKNQMEPILVTLAAGGMTEADDPHPGEELGYVLAGTVVIHLEKKSSGPKKGTVFVSNLISATIFPTAAGRRPRCCGSPLRPAFKRNDHGCKEAAICPNISSS